MDIAKKISILTRTSAGKSAVEQQLANNNISWALDIDGLLGEVATATGSSAAIIELKLDTIVDDCHKVFQASVANSSDLRIFAVGASEIKHWLPLIRVSGFSACWHTLACLNQMRLPINRHFQSRRSQNQFSDDETIEERVWASLPWKPAGRQFN